MKKAFFALTAILVAGLASAVSWTGMATTTTSSNSTSNSMYTGATSYTTNTLTDGTTFGASVAVAFSTEFLTSTSTVTPQLLLGISQNSSSFYNTGVSAGGSGFMVYLTAASADSITLTIYAKSDPLTAESVDGVSTDLNASTTYGNRGTVTISSSLLNSENANGLAITASHSSTTSTGSGTIVYSLYLNGDLLVTGTHSNVGAAYIATSTGTNDTYLLASEEAEFAFSALGVAGIDDLGSVPEPTVLALLALGVAGLALRRRA